MSEDWLKVIKDKMESYESPVPEGVWENVESSIFPARERGPRFMPWVWAFAAAAALALGVFAGLRLIDGNADKGINTLEDNRIAENPTSPDNNISSSADNEGGQVSPKAGGIKEPVRIIPAPEGSVMALAIDNEVLPVLPEIVMEISDNQLDIPESVLEIRESAVKAPALAAQDDTKWFTNHDGEDWSDLLTDPDSPRRRPSAGFSMSSAARGAQDASVLDTKAFFLGVAANMDASTRDVNSIYTRTVSVPVSKNEDHKRPVRMSLSLDFPLTGGLSLGSGLTYSILQSDFTTSSGERVSKETQTLGYLGIPLNLKADIWRENLFTLYASGGGMVEKCVNASAKTAVSMGGEKSVGSIKNKFSVKPLVWSLNAAAGLQANLPGSFGIFLEPGVSYHFAGDTKVKSIYTEHPFDFVMSFGLRYSFK